MGYWNHRLLIGDGYAEIIECSYDDKDQIWGYSKAAPVGNDIKDLKGELKNQMQAFKAPPIYEKDLPNTVIGQVPIHPKIVFGTAPTS